MRRSPWFLNRVFWGMFLFLFVVALWEFYWKPQYKPMYEQGVRQYESGDYARALGSFSQAYAIAPNSTDVILMMGWTNFKLKYWDEARYYFTRALRLDPRIEEAQVGMAFIAFETGKGEIDPNVMTRLLQERRGDPNLQLLAAAALEREGKFFQAADLYRGLLDNRTYGATARNALDNIFGLRGSADAAPAVLASATPAATLQLRFRAADGSLWQQQNNSWQPVYVSGVDFGPAAPGYQPTALPNDNGQYSRWLLLVANLHANVLRAYTLLPPAFYRSYKHYLERGGQASLFQQVWIGDPPNNDLWDSKYIEDTQAEIRYVVDAIHGHGSVPPRRFRAGGVFDNDISARVAAILFGRELDAAVLAQTNAANRGRRRYDGKYISVANGTPVQVWYAQMLDYLVNYETVTYGWQHPVAAISGPAPDPQRAPLLESAFRVDPGFSAGVFSMYPAFSYDPEYVENDPRYQQARDAQGPNPVYGYVRELRSRTPFPLVVSEFGMSTSDVTRRVVASGWNLGGLSEDEQAQFLTRIVRGLKEAGCAGGLGFELMDEWYRQGWSTEGFANPPERARLWVNQLDPAQHYGLAGFHSSRWRLFGTDGALWAGVPKLYSAATASVTADGYQAERRVTSVQAAVDEAYLYLRLKVDCLDCIATRKDGKTHFDKVAYAVAFNTLPNRVGVQRLPFGNIEAPGGVNFLLYLGDRNQARLLVSDNYNPYEIVPRSDIPALKVVRYRRGFHMSLASQGQFVAIPQPSGDNSGALRWGNPDPQAADYDSRAEWFADAGDGVIVVRIPWARLLVTDPSQFQVFSSFEDDGVHSMHSLNMQISVFVLDPQGGGDLAAMKVDAALPSVSGGKLGDPADFRWTGWNVVTPDLYLKKSYFALQREYGQGTGDTAKQSPTAPSGRVSLDRRGEVR